MNRLIFIILFFISKLSYSQDLSWKDLNLKGNVKSIKEVSYKGRLTVTGYIKVGKGWESNWEQDSKTEFDSSGNKVRETFYDSNLKVLRIEKFDFIDGKLMKSEMLYHTKTYQYDSSGRLIFMKEINRQPAQISSSNANSPSKERVSTFKFNYDKRNRLIEKYEFDSKGIKIRTIKYIYDKNDRLITEELITSSNKQWYNYSYDSDGNLISKIWRDNKEGIVEKETYVYKNNVKTQEIFENYDEGELEGKVFYTFENGNEKEIIETDNSGKIDATWSYQYKYDTKGNWIEQIAIINKKDIFIIEREIEYY